MGGHQSARMEKDEWFTPKWIIDALGPFDLDPCTIMKRPWDTAKTHYTKLGDGLSLPWRCENLVSRDYVWCNPPYGNQTWKWLQKMARHGNGISLIFARTETEMFHSFVWENATALLFLKGRLHFHHANGSRAKANAGAPSVLVAYGNYAAKRLKNSGIKGKFITLIP